jgi:hypothetical protein
VDTENLGDDEIDAIGIAEYWLKNYLRSLRGPPLNERHGQGKSDLIRLVSEAIPKSNGSDQAWRGRISTILRQRQDIPRGLACTVLRNEFKIRPKQIETIIRNA